MTDVLSVPASIDTSLSAPPGDPTLTLSQKDIPSKSRLNPFKTLDKPPLLPKPLVTDEPLTALGLGSPGGSSHISAALPQDTPGSSGRINFTSEGSAALSSLHDKDNTAGSASCTTQQGPTARSHLTEDLAAATQQEEDRRASHAQAESSSCSPAGAKQPAGRNGFLSKLVGSSSGSSKQVTPMQARGNTPFELASQQFLQEQGAASPNDEPIANSSLPESPDSNAGQQANRAQHDQRDQEDYCIDGSQFKAAHRVVNSLQALRCKNCAATIM